MSINTFDKKHQSADRNLNGISAIPGGLVFCKTSEVPQC